MTYNPRTYDGNPEVNLLLATLKLAKKDDDQMWHDCPKEYKDKLRRNYNSHEVAGWVASYILEGRNDGS